MNKHLHSIDSLNIRRVNKMYDKLMDLESLHVKNIQHCLYHLSHVYNNVQSMNDKIDDIFRKIKELSSVIFLFFVCYYQL